MRKQIAWMRSPDYDASKPIPADLLDTKPVVISVSNTPRNGKADRDRDDDDHADADDYESHESAPHSHVMDSDDEVSL